MSDQARINSGEDWPRQCMRRILQDLTSLAIISPKIVADPIEGPALVRFVNSAEIPWIELVEASKLVKSPVSGPETLAAPVIPPTPSGAATGQAEAQSDPFEPLTGHILPDGTGPALTGTGPALTKTPVVPAQTQETQTNERTTLTEFKPPHPRRMAGN